MFTSDGAGGFKWTSEPLDVEIDIDFTPFIDALRDLQQQLDSQILYGAAGHAAAAAACAMPTPEAPPDGYTAIKGQGAYYAKERLKQLGAYWHPSTKSWLVPNEHMVTALAQCELAMKAGKLLDADDALGYVPRAVYTGLICYQCGDRFEASHEGAVPDEYYCGCVERRAEHQRLMQGRRAPSTSW